MTAATDNTALLATLATVNQISGDLLEAVDKLNHTRRLFDAAFMAVASLDNDDERKALDALLYTAIDMLEDAISDVDAVRAGRRPCGS